MVNKVNSKRKQVGIIGYGRFGSLLAELLAVDFDLVIYDELNLSNSVSSKGYEWGDLPTVMEQDTLFLAVPISHTRGLLQSIADRCNPGQLIIDVGSVKSMIRDWMLDILPETVEVLNTHPMFGPDSYEKDRDLRMVV